MYFGHTFAFLCDEKIASFFLRIYWGKMMHTPKPRVFGAAVLDVVSVRRRGEEDASNSGDTSSVSSSLVVEPAFIVFQNDQESESSSSSKLRVQKLFQFALDGIERAFAVKAPKATTTGSENYLGVAHCASEGEVVHGWLTASKSILLLATEKREEEEEEKEKVAEEESSMIKTKFRAMESVVARWRMNPLLNEETGKSEVVRKALANAAGMRDAF